MMDRDVVTEFVDRVKVRGVAYLVLLYMLNGATVGELSLIANEDRHTIGDCLKALELRRFVIRVQVGKSDQWRIAGPGLQMLRLDGGIPTIKAPTATTALSSPTETPKAAAEASRDGGKTTNKAVDGLDPKLAAALRGAGIGRNAWPGLAALEHVTAAYVIAHTKYARGRGDSVGLLITRLRAGDAVPEVRTKQETVNERIASAWADQAERSKQYQATRKRARK